MAAEYVTASDEQGFLVSRKRLPDNLENSWSKNNVTTVTAVGK